VFPNNCVIACGGGTPCFYDNLAQMKVKGKVIYLKGSLTYLEQHLEAEQQKRPLLNSNNRQEELAKMLEKRKDFYEQADFIVSAESLSLKYFQTIVKALV
jgi:shikimate kinase